jgi:hypothetical protein
LNFKIPGASAGRLGGKLKEINACFDKNNNAWFSANSKGDHGWEEVPYWLKGYGNLDLSLQGKDALCFDRA